VALASLIVFPDMASIAERFPDVSADRLKDDIAYPAMLTFLPSGFLGLVIASLIAAFMSTISTHLNWGSSYMVHDFYKRFLQKEASEKQLVLTGRICTILIMILASIVGLYTKNAKQLFDFILLFGAGTGLIFILRWFWWRINAWSEISAMFASGIIAILLNNSEGIIIKGVNYNFPIAVLGTTIIWLVVTFFTRPTDKEVLQEFYDKIRPGGPGWKPYGNDSQQEDFSIIKQGILAMISACFMVYGILIGVGYILYAKYSSGLIALGISLLCGIIIIRLWRKMEKIT
jgi:Na+/proline symporter